MLPLNYGKTISLEREIKILSGPPLSGPNSESSLNLTFANNTSILSSHAKAELASRTSTSALNSLNNFLL